MLCRMLSDADCNSTVGMCAVPAVGRTANLCSCLNNRADSLTTVSINTTVISAVSCAVWWLDTNLPSPRRAQRPFGTKGSQLQLPNCTASHKRETSVCLFSNVTRFCYDVKRRDVRSVGRALRVAAMTGVCRTAGRDCN